MALFGFFNYEKAGAGVAKDAPVKRPFFRFFELFGRKFWKFFQLNLLYVLFCLPIVTIGPATCALNAIIRKYVLEQPVFLMSDFWDAFKSNFKRSVFIGIIDIVLVVIYIYTFTYYQVNIEMGSDTFTHVMQAILIATAVYLVMMHFYIYPQIVALDMGMMNILRNSMLLSVLGIKGNLVTLVVGGAFVYGMYIFFPYTLFIMPFLPAAWLSFLNMFNAYPVIQKYIINPYYEKNNLKNPEIPDYKQEKSDGEQEVSVFRDMGGFEQAIDPKKSSKNTRGGSSKGTTVKARGKVIK